MKTLKTSNILSPTFSLKAKTFKFNNEQKRKMIKLIFLTIFLLINTYSFSQTDSIVLYKYNSLVEWNSDSLEKTTFFNSHYKGGYFEFEKNFYEIFHISQEYSDLCSVGVILFSLELSKDTVKVEFKNNFSNVIKKEIEICVRTLKEKWINLPIKKVEYNFSLTFKFVFKDGELKGDTNATFKMSEYKFGLIGDPSICDCVYKDSKKMQTLFESSLKNEDYETSLFCLKELMRQQPFNIDIHKKYFSVKMMMMNK